jgi:hypothetical protein
MPQKSTFSIVICFFAFMLLYGLTSRADIQLTDEAAIFASGISLATRGSYDIDSLRWLQQRENLGHEGVGGHLFPKYFPGNILGVAAIYYLTQKSNDAPYINYGYELKPEPHVFADSNFGARFALRLNALLGAIGVTTLYMLLLRRYDWKTATLSVLLFGLCTQWWYESRGLFSEVGAGTFLLLSLLFADVGFPGLSGFSLGFSLLFRPTNLLGIPIWLYSVWKKGLRSIWSGIFIGLGLVGLLFFNWLRFNSWWDFGYINEHFNAWIIEGLVGILFSPGRSIFFYSPILILCISGARMLFKFDQVFTRTILAVIAGYILAVAQWHSWEGGASWGSRLLTPVLPLLGILLTPMVEKALSTSPEKTGFYILLLATFGFGIQLLTLALNTTYVLNHYTELGQISYTDTIKSFQDSWLSLQIRYLQNWSICNIDSYSIQQLFTHCK